MGAGQRTPMLRASPESAFILGQAVLLLRLFTAVLVQSDQQKMIVVRHKHDAIVEQIFAHLRRLGNGIYLGSSRFDFNDTVLGLGVNRLLLAEDARIGNAGASVHRMDD